MLTSADDQEGGTLGLMNEYRSHLPLCELHQPIRLGMQLIEEASDPATLLAAALLPTISLLWHDVALAAAVSLAVLGASTLATMVAMSLPYLLHRIGFDPAFGSGPLATVVQDLLSIVLYLAAVRLIL